MEEKYTFYSPIQSSLKRKNLKSNLKIFLFLLLINPILNEITSEIHLVIKGSGTQEVINQGFTPIPHEIFVNGEKKAEDSRTCELEGEINNITLKFNTQLLSCGDMFNSLQNLIEIDFSDFDSSQVTSMKSMFWGCPNLEKVHFGNIDTSSLEEIEKLFQGCNNLISVDLSSFDTSKIKSLESLFCECYKLTSIDISNFDTSKVTNMIWMFHACSSLETINFGNINTSSVERMSEMFFGCSILKSIDLSKFDTSSVVDMDKLFQQCKELISVDFSNLDTSKVTNMEWMFESCYNLKSVNFGNLNTTSLENMAGMFCNCYNLVSVNFSNFDTSKVTNMEHMFTNCYSTKYLDLSSFNTSKVKNMNSMFFACYSMTYLNIESFQLESIENMENIFYGFSSNVVFCIQDDEIKNNLSYPNRISFCSEDCFGVNNTKIDIDNKKCIDSCLNSDINNYEYNGICYDKCPNGTLLYNNICSNNECENDPDSSQCSDGKPIGYYFDSNEQIYLKCYDSCKLCYGEGNETNNNCIECKDNFRFLNNTLNITNCYENCEYFYYFDKSNKYHCTESDKCPAEYGKLIEEKNQCVAYDCLNNDDLTISCSMEETKNNSEIYDILVNNILATYDGDNGKSIIIEGHNNTIFQVTNTKNELDLLMNGNISDDYNLSIIDLSECEKKLKEKYNIAEEDSLIFIKQEKVTDKESEKNIQYECFEPYNKTKLNLSICSGVNINIYVPLTLSEEIKNMADQIKELGYNMFDINDKFYQDICSPYKSTVGSDILLSDRVDYIYNNEDSQCQGNCEFTSYALGSRYINCTCSTEEDKGNEGETEKIDKFEAKSIYEMFYNVLKYSNYDVFKCYKLTFDKSAFTKNKGSILILTFFVLYLGCAIIYFIKGINPLKTKIDEIIIEKGKKLKIFFPPSKKRISNLKTKPKESKRRLSTLQNENKKKNSKIQFIIFEKNNEKKESNTNIYLNKNDAYSVTDKNMIKIFDSRDLDINKNEAEEKLDDYELNDLEFKEAIKSDKRSFLQMYFYFIKREHRIIFTFFICKDYNLIYIKLIRFIFLFTSDMAMNVFFFSDASMHKIYINYGKYDVLQQIPQIIYSTIVSQLIEVFLCFLSLTDKHIYQIKNLEINQRNKKKIKIILRCIELKLFFYFLFTFICFGIYWYIISSFCAVYENTQMAFIKDSLMSFLLSSVIPFILYLIPSSLRLWAIRCKNPKLEFIYKLSDVIPFF